MHLPGTSVWTNTKHTSFSVSNQTASAREPPGEHKLYALSQQNQPMGERHLDVGDNVQMSHNRFRETNNKAIHDCRIHNTSGLTQQCPEELRNKVTQQVVSGPQV